MNNDELLIDLYGPINFRILKKENELEATIKQQTKGFAELNTLRKQIATEKATTEQITKNNQNEETALKESRKALQEEQYRIDNILKEENQNSNPTTIKIDTPTTLHTSTKDLGNIILATITPTIINILQEIRHTDQSYTPISNQIQNLLDKPIADIKEDPKENEQLIPQKIKERRYTTGPHLEGLNRHINTIGSNISHTIGFSLKNTNQDKNSKIKTQNKKW